MEKEQEIVDTEYTFDIVYNFLLKHKKFFSSSEIMKQCNLNKTQYYNTLEQLKKMKLIEVRIDMKDFRKKYYKAKE